MIWRLALVDKTPPRRRQNQGVFVQTDKSDYSRTSPPKCRSLHLAYFKFRILRGPQLAAAPTLCSRCPVAGWTLRRWQDRARLHRALRLPALLAQTSDALRSTSAWSRTLLLVRPFAHYRQLLRPLLTSRSALRRRPFSHEARSPRVRTHSFAAQPPDLRRLALITRASRNYARSPCSAAPSIRFLFIGSQLRSTLPPHNQSPSCSCASLRSL